MNPRVLLLALVACSGAGAPHKATGWSDPASQTHSQLAAYDEAAPTYDRADLERTLTAERAAALAASGEIAQLEQGEPETLRIALADLAVRRRFIATLEVCKADEHLCPPRLEESAWTGSPDGETDPKLDVPLRFDADSWRKVASELHGHACACRTLACVDSIDATLNRLETRPMPEVQSDDAALVELTRARDCLMRLRGSRGIPRVVADE
jgi:hypothetical protein